MSKGDCFLTARLVQANEMCCRMSDCPRGRNTDTGWWPAWGEPAGASSRCEPWTGPAPCTESRKLLTFKRQREKLRTPNQSWLNLESINGTCESLLSRRDWPVSRSYKEKRSFADSESGRNWTHVCRLRELLSLNLYPGKKTIWRNQGMLFHFLISCLSWVSCNHGVGEVSPDVERNRTLARPPRDASSIQRITLADAANARDVLAHQQF